MSNPVVVVVDDEAQIRKLLAITLQANGYDVVMCEDARAALITIASHPPDVVLLDLGLPDQSGFEVLRRLREWYTNPVLILSVQDGEDDIVKALDAGANDYLVKPFRTGELLARMRSALRQQAHEEDSAALELGDLSVDLSARVVKKDGHAVKLTATEYNLLALMVKNEGKVLTHQFLLTQIWGPSYREESQYLRVFVAQLRKKIETDPNRPVHLITESRVGYRFIGK